MEGSLPVRLWRRGRKRWRKRRRRSKRKRRRRGEGGESWEGGEFDARNSGISDLQLGLSFRNMTMRTLIFILTKI